MPIRFRCERCGQLLGIARRKAGTLVNCPTCQQQVLVPAEDEPGLGLARPEPTPSPLPAPVPPPSPGNLFDRDDFDVILAGGNGPSPVSVPSRAGGAVHVPPPAPVPASPAAPVGAPSWPQFEQPALPTGSIVLSPGRATVLTVVMVLLLALSFLAGLLVGRFAL